MATHEVIEPEITKALSDFAGGEGSVREHRFGDARISSWAYPRGTREVEVKLHKAVTDLVLEVGSRIVVRTREGEVAEGDRTTLTSHLSREEARKLRDELNEVLDD